MNDRAKQRESLVAASLNAARRQQARQSRPPAGASPRVGDVFLFPEPADLDFRWVVAVVEASEYYVVPADTHFLVGRTDLVLTDTEQDVSLVARCDFGCWLEEACFHGGRWLTALDPPLSPALRERILSSRLGAPGMDPEDGEVEADPLYQEWLEFVAAAVGQLVDDFVARSWSARVAHPLGPKPDAAYIPQPVPQRPLAKLQAELNVLASEREHLWRERIVLEQELSMRRAEIEELHAKLIAKQSKAEADAEQLRRFDLPNVGPFGALLADLAVDLRRGVCCLVVCDKGWVLSLFVKLKERLIAAGLKCGYLDGRAAADAPAETGTMLTSIVQIRSAVRGENPDGAVFALPHLDVMTAVEGGWNNISREVIPLLYENPASVWLGFQDPTLPIMPIVQKLFAKRYVIEERYRNLNTVPPSPPTIPATGDTTSPPPEAN
jgi:hypothetical protein